jgi:oxygen-dependent protoporphyrinogen oxidase
MAGFIGELGLSGERLEASPEARNRYVVREGRLGALPQPSSAWQFLTSPILSPRAKWRVLRERSQQPRERAEDASVSAFMADHFGEEVVARVVQPFVSGIWAGDPARLSARHAFPRMWDLGRTQGSLLRAGAEAARKRRAEGLAPSAAVVSFRGGMQALIDALAARLPAGSVHLGAEARAVAPGSGARWRVEWMSPGGPRGADVDAVASAMPAGGLARLRVGPEGATPLAGLGAIEHPPVASVFVGYARENVRHALDGFGALVPSREGKSILGIIFTSTLFPGRAPEGHVALTVLVGGALQPDIALLSVDELEGRVLADLGSLLGTAGKPAFLRHTPAQRAIPQYNLGHERHLQAIAACEAANPGLFIGGNARDGISIPECMRSGASLASRVS